MWSTVRLSTKVPHCHFQKTTSSQTTKNRAFHAAMNTSFVPEEKFISCKIPEVQFIVFWGWCLALGVCFFPLRSCQSLRLEVFKLPHSEVLWWCCWTFLLVNAVVSWKWQKSSLHPLAFVPKPVYLSVLLYFPHSKFLVLTNWRVCKSEKKNEKFSSNLR